MENRLDESIEHARRFAEQLENAAQKYDDLQRSMTELRVTARSDDGSVEVTVDSNGVPVAIELAESTRGRNPAVTSAAIMDCMRSAQAKLRQRVANLVSGLVGDDSPAADMVSRYEQRFPDPDPIDTAATQDAAASNNSWRPGAESFYAPPAPSSPSQPWSRKPNRDQVVAPDEPDEDEQYYNRKSWLV
ncbi:YbaB/EbfC family nucleoid-associated protein [Nocardia neocaledoniensis]|uniref:YbaB/EbfC family nucleoid-associated protein n=1 Tax=Nocardia neocaledoniensis TaxID=236511 RepID=UPI0024560B34|nr:YbaB/EbfC family nucleoid-associated protein [Nocardia neocaledoniensis]